MLAIGYIPSMSLTHKNIYLVAWCFLFCLGIIKHGLFSSSIIWTLVMYSPHQRFRTRMCGVCFICTLQMFLAILSWLLKSLCEMTFVLYPGNKIWWWWWWWWFLSPSYWFKLSLDCLLSYCQLTRILDFVFVPLLSVKCIVLHCIMRIFCSQLKYDILYCVFYILMRRINMHISATLRRKKVGYAAVAHHRRRLRLTIR